MKWRSKWEGASIKAQGISVKNESGEPIEGAVPGLPAIEGVDIEIGGAEYEVEISGEEMLVYCGQIKSMIDYVIECIPRIQKTCEEAFGSKPPVVDPDEIKS